ncbi:hypothetical protein BLNAU_2605 [Blattamonas nauphoetae]|uniref:Uncharacterized protein n=1 Tax=Blattamonas nauphoetae TaxID=2049346 RepID=A0ABQ9YF31_9EUKA|nr:hypothetical protein BLNAU_2605 [Blattamonas nauphoetae]
MLTRFDRRHSAMVMTGPPPKHSLPRPSPTLPGRKVSNNELPTTPTRTPPQSSLFSNVSRAQLTPDITPQTKQATQPTSKEISPLTATRSEIQSFIGDDVELVTRKRFDSSVAFGLHSTEANVPIDFTLKQILSTVSATTLRRLIATRSFTMDPVRFSLLRTFFTSAVLFHSSHVLSLIDAEPTNNFNFPSFLPDKLEPDQLTVDPSYFHRISSEWQQAQLKKNSPGSAIHLLIRHRLRPAYITMLMLLLGLFAPDDSKAPEVSTQDLVLFQNTVLFDSVPTLRQHPPVDNEVLDPSSNKAAGMGIVLFLHEHRILSSCLNFVRTTDEALKQFDTRSNPQNTTSPSDTPEVSIPSTLRISTQSVQLETRASETIQLMSNPARLMRTQSPRSFTRKNGLIAWMENRLEQLVNSMSHTIASTPSHLLFSLCLSPHPLVSKVAFHAIIHLYSLNFKTNIHPYRRWPITGLSFLLTAVNARYDHVRTHAQALVSRILSSSVWAFFYARTLLALDVDLKAMIQRTERRPQTENASPLHEQNSFYQPFGDRIERYVPHLAHSSICSFTPSFIPPPQRFTTLFFSSKQALSEEVKGLFERVAAKQKERRDEVIENLMNIEPDDVPAPTSARHRTAPIPPKSRIMTDFTSHRRTHSNTTSLGFTAIHGRTSPSHSSGKVDDENSSTSVKLMHPGSIRVGSNVPSPTISSPRNSVTTLQFPSTLFPEVDEHSARLSPHAVTSELSMTPAGHRRSRSGNLIESTSLRHLHTQKENTIQTSVQRNTLQPEHHRREESRTMSTRTPSPAVDIGGERTPLVMGSPLLEDLVDDSLTPTFPPTLLTYSLVHSSVPTTVSLLPSSRFICALLAYPIGQSRSSSDLQFLAGNTVFSVIVEISTANRIFSQDTSVVLRRLCQAASKFNMIAVGPSFKVTKGKGGLFQTSRKKQANSVDQNSLFTSIIVEKDDLDRFVLIQDYIAFDETYENIFISLCSLMSSTAFFEAVRTNAPSLLNYIVDACFKDHPVLTQVAWRTCIGSSRSTS